MSGFHFSLEKVLRWRSAQLAGEEAKLKTLLQEQLQLQIQRAELGAKKSKLLPSLGAMPDLRGRDLHAASANLLFLRRQAVHLDERLARIEKDLAAQKKKYQVAQQKVRLLEELRTRKLDLWRSETGRELETLATESYLAGWSHGQR